MHISLDSALGRQRRLNSVGESITQIAPDPAAAYSLRSLTGGDPKVVRVRRGSDNHEQDFTASEVSSGALVAYVGSGNDGFVETWYDQSGNSNNAVQATAANQPKIVDAGAFLGKLLFDGSNDSFALNNSLIMPQPVTMFAQYAATGTAALVGNSGTFGRSSNTYLMVFNSAISAGTHGSDDQIASVIFNASNSEGYFNNVKQLDGDAGLGSLQISQLGLFTSLYFVGHMREFFIYDSDQSSNRTAIETNMNSHYSIF